MAKLLFKEVDIVVQPGITTVYNSTIGGNLIQVHNRKVASGGTIYIDSRDTVTPNAYLQKVEAGNSGSIVRPYSLSALYITTDALIPITATIIEVVVQDLSVLFNSSQVLQIQGSVTIQEPITISAGEIEVKNDVGNPLSVSSADLASLVALLTATNAKLDAITTLVTGTNTKLDTVNTNITATNTKLDTANTKLQAIIDKP